MPASLEPLKFLRQVRPRTVQALADGIGGEFKDLRDLFPCEVLPQREPKHFFVALVQVGCGFEDALKFVGVLNPEFRRWGWRIGEGSNPGMQSRTSRPAAPQVPDRAIRHAVQPPPGCVSMRHRLDAPPRCQECFGDNVVDTVVLDPALDVDNERRVVGSVQMFKTSGRRRGASSISVLIRVCLHNSSVPASSSSLRNHLRDRDSRLEFCHDDRCSSKIGRKRWCVHGHRESVTSSEPSGCASRACTTGAPPQDGSTRRQPFLRQLQEQSP